jgi:hypothetical protein
MFFFSKRKVVVDCFTSMPIIADEYAIRRAIKLAPSWWKSLEDSFEVPTSIGIKRKLHTLKFCKGFTDLYKNSWIMPLWTDIFVQTAEDGGYKYLTPNDFGDKFINGHFPKQHEGAFNSYIQLKVASPWIIREKKGVNFLYKGADWSLVDDQPDVRILDGVVNYKSQASSNISMLVPKKQADYKFYAGSPLMMFVPLTEDDVLFKIHSVTTAEFDELSKLHSRHRNRLQRM